MAQDIQRILEQSIPEVEDLLERGIFSKEEVAALVAKRRDFETRLHRFEAIKEDYLQYIEYEINLDKLREKRKQRLNIKRKGLADYACIRRVNFIFDRAIRKFKGDIDLWVAAVEFAEVKQQKDRVGNLLASAIRLFPNRDGFWIMAASHELDQNKNIGEARAVMMQGLRVNPKSESMWTEYFRLEFLFINQVLERRNILGVESDEPAIIKGDLLKIVYRNAISAVPESCDFRFEFLRICELFEETAATEAAKELAQYILNDVQKDFGESEPRVWREIARQNAKDSKEEEEIYETACGKCPSEGLWEIRIVRAKERGDNDLVLQLAKRAFDINLLSESAALIWVEALTPNNNEPAKKRTRKTTRKSSVSDEDNSSVDLSTLLVQLTERFPTSAPLWLLRCDSDNDNSEEVVLVALESIPSVESLPFWERAISFDSKNLSLAIRKLVKERGCEEIVETLITQALMKSNNPKDVVRELEATVINQIPLECFHAIFQGGESKNISDAELRALFNQCVARYPESAISWKAYIDFEKEKKNVKAANSLLSRALIAAPDIKDIMREMF